MRLVVGIQPVREAIRAHGDRIERVIVERDGSVQLEALARFARDRGIRVETALRADLDKRSGGVRHQGTLALAPELEVRDIDSLDLGSDGVAIVLDGIMDPQNFGAVIRSAVALGARAVVWPEHSSAPLSPATFRASAGAVEHATLCRVASLPDALRHLADRGAVTVALDAQGTDDLGALDLKGPVALVIGAEDKGTRRSVRRSCRYVARLRMPGPIGSLNASVAAALALYEVLRQRLPEPAAGP